VNQPRHLHRPLFWCLLLAALLAGPALAADRALLVGVGVDAKSLQLPLEGIDLDLDLMRRVAANLGFAPADIRVLQDAQATQSAVQAALVGWLREGVAAEDRVLIYFSTHGSQVPDLNGDEADGADEVLILYDLGLAATPDGRATLRGVLLDDDFEQALAALPSRHVLVVLDACHSGTATRSLDLASRQSGSRRVQVKSFAYPGMPTAASPRTLSRPGPAAPYVLLAAAADDEQSLASDRGSLFTQGLAHAIGGAVTAGERLSARQALDASARFVADQLGVADRASLFHPQLGGDLALAEQPLRLTAVTAGHGPTWALVAGLAGPLTPLRIAANQPRFREGEPLELRVEVPRDGYLNVIAIDARDTPIVLFPNRHHRDHAVRAGQVNLPGGRPFRLPATPPAGPTLLAAFLSDQPLDLFDNGDGPRDLQGTIQTVFAQLSAVGTRGFAVAAKDAGTLSAGVLEVTVCPPAGCP